MSALKVFTGLWLIHDDVHPHNFRKNELWFLFKNCQLKQLYIMVLNLKYHVWLGKFHSNEVLVNEVPNIFCQWRIFHFVKRFIALKLHLLWRTFSLVYALYTLKETNSSDFWWQQHSQATRITYTDTTHTIAVPNFSINIWKFKRLKYEPTWRKHRFW